MGKDQSQRVDLSSPLTLAGQIGLGWVAVVATLAGNRLCDQDLRHFLAARAVPVVHRYAADARRRCARAAPMAALRDGVVEQCAPCRDRRDQSNEPGARAAHPGAARGRTEVPLLLRRERQDPEPRAARAGERLRRPRGRFGYPRVREHAAHRRGVHRAAGRQAAHSGAAR